MPNGMPSDFREQLGCLKDHAAVSPAGLQIKDQQAALGNDALLAHDQAISLAMMPSMIPNREKSLPP